MKTFAVHLAEGFEEIEAVTIIDVLRRAGFDVNVVSVTNELTVNGAHNIPVVADTLFENIDYEYIDMIILPGGMPGAKNLGQHKGLVKAITDFYKKDKFVGAICAAPMVLGQLGLLRGKKATCYPGFENYLEKAEVTGSNFELVDNIITGKGIGAALDFSLRIVEIFKGKEFAEELSAQLVYNLE